MHAYVHTHTTAKRKFLLWCKIKEFQDWVMHFIIDKESDADVFGHLQLKNLFCG